MVGKSFLLHTVLFVLALSLQHFEYAESKYSTAVFDVSASIQRTLDVFSFNPPTQHLHHEQQKSKSTTPESSSTFSLSLHPRSSLIKPLHNNYTALTLSRLQRNYARVNSITAALNPPAMETSVISGGKDIGEYFTRVGVGQPPKQYYMVMDTGSDVSWVKCNPCTNCDQETIFIPSDSSSYSPLTCNSPQCDALSYLGWCTTDGLCQYNQSYFDDTFTTGDFATETLTFGNSMSVNGIAIGCSQYNEGFKASSGLIGLGGGDLSLPYQIQATSFSYCLVDRNSQQWSTLDFNSVTPGDSVTTPLIRNQRFEWLYFVELNGISVGGQQLSIPPSLFQIDNSGYGGVIIDSGTTVTTLHPQAYNSLRDAFIRMTPNLPLTSGFESYDTCYDLSSMGRISVPTVSFQFAGGETLSFPPKNYLVPVDSSGKTCLGFAPMPESESISIIGNVLQQHIRVSYDLANSVIGFSPNNC